MILNLAIKFLKMIVILIVVNIIIINNNNEKKPEFHQNFVLTGKEKKTEQEGIGANSMRELCSDQVKNQLNLIAKKND